MVDAGAIPLKLGIAVCSANAPRQLPTAHAVEADEMGPSSFSQIPRWESSRTLTMDAMSHSTNCSLNPVTISHYDSFIKFQPFILYMKKDITLV